MKRLLSILFLTVAGAAAIQPARAQVTDVGSVREYIERNAELLEFAAGLVSETNSVKARSLLDTARSLHVQSLALLNQGSVAMAARTAFRAREVIQQTISVARGEARLEEQATKAIERAGIRLEQARTAVEDAGRNDQNLLTLLGEATELLRRSREQMGQHMFETALRLAESSAAASLRVLRIVRRDLADGADVDDEIERTQAVLDRLSDVAANATDPVARLATQAADMQRRAVRSREEGQTARAVEETRAARTLALRTLRASGPSDGSREDDAHRAVTITDEVLEGAAALATESGDERAARALADARRIQEDARRALSASDFGRAEALTRRAREVARDALREAGGDVSPATAEAAIAGTDDAIAKLREALDSIDDADARSLLDRARSRQASARDALASKDTRRALTLTRVAHSLAREGLSRIHDARG